MCFAITLYISSFLIFLDSYSRPSLHGGCEVEGIYIIPIFLTYSPSISLQVFFKYITCHIVTKREVEEGCVSVCDNTRFASDIVLSSSLPFPSPCISAIFLFGGGYNKDFFL